MLFLFFLREIMDLELAYYYFIVEGFELDLYIKRSSLIVVVFESLEKYCWARFEDLVKAINFKGYFACEVLHFHPYCCSYGC